MNNEPLHVVALPGLGDAIYQRPHLKALVKRHSNVYLETGFPQLFEDILGLKFVKPAVSLRVYDANVLTLPEDFWVERDPRARIIEPNYGIKYFGKGDTIATAFNATLPLKGEPLIYDLPPGPLATLPVIDTGGRPLAVVRPVTTRGAFPNTARAPLPEYVYAAAARLMTTHHVVSIADIDDENEIRVGDPLPCHQRFDHGELSILAVLELMRDADCLVGGVGFIVTVSLAAQRPALIVVGGNGRFNSPEALVDPRASSDFLTFAVPDDLCYCDINYHSCDKTISNFEERLAEWHQAIQHSTT